MVHISIQRKIALLQEYCGKLKSYVTLNTNFLLGNEEKQAAMERWFILMVDEAIDINAALAYQLGGKIPESHKSTFLELVPLKILELDFAEQISESVKVRNQMTHDYEKVQRMELIDAMKRFAEMYKIYLGILITKFIPRPA